LSACRITAVLPAYNEEAGIESAVRQLAAVLRALAGEAFEVVVTNDGSLDRTGEVLTNLGDSAPELHLKVVTHPRNRGYGAALASGFNAARGELIFFRVLELPVPHLPRTTGSPTGARLDVIARAFLELVRLRLTLSRGPRARQSIAPAARAIA
jgi:hypothetical protein